MSGIADLLGPLHGRPTRSRGIPQNTAGRVAGQQKPFLPSSKAPDGTTRLNVPRDILPPESIPRRKHKNTSANA